jgi:hypothetical protein
MLLPSHIATDFPLVSATHRVMLDRLGLVGFGREGIVRTLTANSFRTIFDAADEQAWTGEVLVHNIELGYDYDTSTFDANVVPTAWYELVPHFAFGRRLMPELGETIEPMSVLGRLEAPANGGSEVDALEGYRTFIPEQTIDDLDLQALLTGVALNATTVFDFNVLEDFYSTISGSERNLYWNEADVAFAFVDQDVFDVEAARLACLRNVSDNVIPIGPIPLVVIYSKDGNLISSMDSVETISQVSSAPAAPAPAAPDVSEDDIGEMLSED